MNVIGREWMEFTRDERMVILKFAVEENQKRKAALAGSLSK